MNPKHPITNGAGEDITEAVQILYDMVMNSMEMGSGLFSNDEMANIVRCAVVMGWEVPNLDGDTAMASVAAKYPDHYEVYETTFRDNALYQMGRRHCRIIRKGQPLHLRPGEYILEPGEPLPPIPCLNCGKIHEVKT